MKTPRSFTQLTAYQRDRIQALYGRGYNQVDVARVLGVSKSTVSRELRRYNKATWRYVADYAQRDAEAKRAHSKRVGMKIEYNAQLKTYIIAELTHLRSPDEIAGHMKRMDITPRVSTAAIYRWLYSDAGKPYCQYLCTKRPRQKPQYRLTKRILIPDRISLRDRPIAPHLIHAEGDLFVSPTRLHVKTCGLVVVEPSSKLLTGCLIANKTTASIVPAMRHILRRFVIDDLTLDNGIENIHHREFGVDTYFCDRGSPWQKPHVESSIGLMRRWGLPKGTNLATISEELLQSLIHFLNHKRRKSLGYRSAYEVALERGIITKVPRVSLFKVVAFR